MITWATVSPTWTTWLGAGAPSGTRRVFAAASISAPRLLASPLGCNVFAQALARSKNGGSDAIVRPSWPIATGTTTSAIATTTARNVP